MQTQRLIDSLADGLLPVPPRAVERRIGAALALGMAISVMLVAVVLGIRHDLLSALQGSVFWMKAGYVGSLAALAALASVHLARPDTAPPRWLWLSCLPVIIIAGLAGADMAHAPPEAWAALWLGKSWKVCPFLVLGLSIPIFAALMRTLRKLAPTRLRATGALAGVTAGAAAALVYCLHCPESTAGFLLVWYSGGIGLAGLIGAALGPRLLRW
jgi:hypothetical protein